MAFDLLPTEIHAFIFERACFSDVVKDEPTYQTALNLCLVSRYVYTLTVPVLYRTLFLAGRSRVSLLSRTLASRPDLAECALHIFLCDRSQRPRSGMTGDVVPSQVEGLVESSTDESSLEVLPSYAFEIVRTREGRIDRLQRMQMWLNARVQSVDAFRQAALHILALTGPRLETLTIALYVHYDRTAESGLSEILALPFPSLTELTIRDNAFPRPWPAVVLPALKRMHLAGGVGPGISAALTSLHTGCPQLTHLRLTEPFLNDALVTTLEQSLRTEIQSSDGDSSSPRLIYPVPRLPPLLSRLILEPSPFILSGTRRPEGVRDAFERLNDLSAEFNALELVPAPPAGRRGDRYPFTEARRDWKSSLLGQEGCWRVAPAQGRSGITRTRPYNEL